MDQIIARITDMAKGPRSCNDIDRKLGQRIAYGVTSAR